VHPRIAVARAAVGRLRACLSDGQQRATCTGRVDAGAGRVRPSVVLVSARCNAGGGDRGENDNKECEGAAANAHALSIEHSSREVKVFERDLRRARVRTSAHVSRSVRRRDRGHAIGR
jgi:hypothetical protein